MTTECEDFLIGQGVGLMKSIESQYFRMLEGNCQKIPEIVQKSLKYIED